MNWRRWARVAGSCLALAATLFIVRRLLALEIWRQDVDWRDVVLALVVAAPVYAAGVVLLAVAWLALLGRSAPPAWSGVAWYLLSQFGKYLPGNVAHLAGRHLLFAGARVPQSTLLAAATLEAGLLVAAGAAVALVFSPLEMYRALVAASAPAAATGFLVLVLVLALVGLWFGRRSLLRRERLLASGFAFTLCLAFFVLAGAILVALAAFLGGPGMAAGHWRLIMAACAAAWLCGFVVPGAPGGLGIRESVLLVLLSPALGGEAAMLMALTYRGVTISGDGIAALAGAVMTRWPARPQAAA